MRGEVAIGPSIYGVYVGPYAPSLRYSFLFERRSVTAGQ